MKVRAFSTHSTPPWRWRIVDDEGATIEESPLGFSTIASAIVEGNERIRELRITAPGDDAS